MRYLLDQSDVAGMLQVNVREIKQLVRSGEFPHVPLPSGEIRFIESDVWQWARSKMKPGVLPEVGIDATS